MSLLELSLFNELKLDLVLKLADDILSKLIKVG